MFYALAHISKYIPPGSQRIKMHSDDNKGLSSAAFLRDDGNIVIVILNRYTLLLLLLLKEKLFKTATTHPFPSIFDLLIVQQPWSHLMLLASEDSVRWSI